MVGLGGIEPPTRAPKARMLPLYHSPFRYNSIYTVFSDLGKVDSNYRFTQDKGK